MSERFYYGTAEAIEAEYGVAAEGAAFVLLATWNGDVAQTWPFKSLEAIRAELAWVEDRSIIEHLV